MVQDAYQIPGSEMFRGSDSPKLEDTGIDGQPILRVSTSRNMGQ